MDQYFRLFAQWASAMAGTAWAFIVAVGVLVVWGVTAPVFEFSDTWQLVINTFTTVVTFLMVFLIQNTQNRDAKVFHLKLDELLRAVKRAHGLRESGRAIGCGAAAGGRGISLSAPALWRSAVARASGDARYDCDARP